MHQKCTEHIPKNTPWDLGQVYFQAAQILTHVNSIFLSEFWPWSNFPKWPGQNLIPRWLIEIVRDFGEFKVAAKERFSGAVPVMLSGIGGPGAPHHFEISRREDLGPFHWKTHMIIVMSSCRQWSLSNSVWSLFLTCVDNVSRFNCRFSYRPFLEVARCWEDAIRHHCPAAWQHSFATLLDMVPAFKVLRVYVYLRTS